MLGVLVVNAASTIMLLLAIEAMQQWLIRSACRIRLHYIPSYCLHLDPIERLRGLMHRHTTHNIAVQILRISVARY
jgi:hypothetical protein